MRSKLYTIGLFLFLFGGAKAQKLSKGSFGKQVTFTHQPMILFRVNATPLFHFNNALQVGAEIAPTVGLLSFCFDYAVGSSKSGFNKTLKKLSDNKTKEISVEIRAYFSDLYPFYALDKKPFGRYWALEYVNGKYDRNLPIAYAVEGKSLPNYAQFYDTQYREKTQILRLKLGRHIHIHRHFFLDIYGGIGAGFYKSSAGQIVNIDGELETTGLKVLHMGILTKKRLIHMPDSKGIMFSPAGGLRFVFPI